MTRVRFLEPTLLVLVLVAQAALLTRPIHSAVNYDEAVYLGALDALRHDQALGSDVFAAQFPGFYDLLRGLSFVTGIAVAPVRGALVAVTLLGTIGGWLVGRRYGGPVGGLLVASFLVIAPPLDLFGFQVIADTPALALMTLSLGIATLAAPAAAVAAGAVLAASFSIKLTAVTVLPAVLWCFRGRLGPAAAGFGAVVAVELVAHAGALGELWSSGVTYHQEARHTPDVIPHPRHQIFDQIPHTTPFFLLAFLAAGTAIAFAVLRRPLRVWPLWTWVVLSVAFLLLHAPLHYNHLVLFPYALAVASGATIGAALEQLPRRTGLALSAALALAIVAGYVQQMHRVAIARAPEPSTNVDAARALERLTRPGARTIDDRPIISFLAHRRVLGSLVDIATLRFETGSLTDAAVIRQLPRADAVVISRALRDRPAIKAKVKAQFYRRYDRGGVEIWTRR